MVIQNTNNTTHIDNTGNAAYAGDTSNTENTFNTRSKVIICHTFVTAIKSNKCNRGKACNRDDFVSTKTQVTRH